MFLLLRRLEVLLWNSKERGTKKKKSRDFGFKETHDNPKMAD